MLRKVNGEFDTTGAMVKISDASYPSPFVSGLEYSSPARGTWNIVHTGMLVPEAHEIFVCAASCLRGVVLTAAEMHAEKRFSTVAIREHNLLDGDMEELIIDGVSDIVEKLPHRPPAVLVYTSCVHHFAGCDLEMVYDVLGKRFPDIDFTDCYMNPIMRKSGLNPDQLMRRQMYSLLKKRELNPKSIAVIGNDFETDKDSELIKMISNAGFTLHEITACKTYEEYQKIAESSIYISYYPAAEAGGDYLREKLGGKHFYLPFSFNYDEIENNLNILSDALGVERYDFSDKRKKCDEVLKKAFNEIGNTPIAIDYTVVSRPIGLARMLLDSGFNVKRIYGDGFTGEEKKDFEYLKEKYPDLEIYATVHTKMRFMANKTKSDFLAIGQKAAYFTGTNHFVNIVEGGGMYGFEAVERMCLLMLDAYRCEKDMRNLVQIKGMGCECCI